MAASTHAVAKAVSTVQPVGDTAGGNAITVTSYYSATANLSANDVFQMVQIPNGATVIDGYTTMTSSDAFTYTVGDGASTARFVPSSSVSGAFTIARFSDGLPHQYTADDTIDIKFTAVTATKHLSFWLTVTYLMDGQSDS